jgi:hypothetical protein
MLASWPKRSSRWCDVTAAMLHRRARNVAIDVSRSNFFTFVQWWLKTCVVVQKTGSLPCESVSHGQTRSWERC